MPAYSRREFLKQSTTTVAAAGFFAAGARGLRASPLGLPIGSQTYPHRQRIKDGDLAGLCKDMAALGIGSIELCSPGYEEFASLADAAQTRKIIEDHGSFAPALTSPWTNSAISSRSDRVGQRHRHDADGYGQPRWAGAERRCHHGRREKGRRRVQQDRRAGGHGRHPTVPTRRAVRDVQGRRPADL